MSRLQYLGLVEHFDGVVTKIFLVTCQYHSSKRTFAERSHQLEVIKWRPRRLLQWMADNYGFTSLHASARTTAWRAIWKQI